MADLLSKTVYAKTPKGRRLHGRIVENNKGNIIFVRRIDGRYVRWSDRTFCINTSVVPVLKEHKVDRIVFFYRRAEVTEGHRVLIGKALEITPIMNELGETNIRIPIDECELVKVWKNEDWDLISDK